MTSKNTFIFIVLIASSAMADFLPNIQTDSNHENRLLTSFPYPGVTVEGKREIRNVAYSRNVRQGCDDKYSSETSGGNIFEFTEVGVESGEYPYYTIKKFNSSDYICSSGSNEVVMYTVPGENCYWYPLQPNSSNPTYCFMNSVSEYFLSSRGSSQSYKINQQFYCGTNEAWKLPLVELALPGYTITDQEPRTIQDVTFGQNLVSGTNGTYDATTGTGHEFKFIEGGVDEMYGVYYYIYSKFNEVVCLRDDGTIGDETFEHVAKCEWYLWEFQTGGVCIQNRDFLWSFTIAGSPGSYVLSKYQFCGTHSRWNINEII